MRRPELQLLPTRWPCGYGSLRSPGRQRRMPRCLRLLLHLTRIMPLQHGDRLRIGLLQVDAPVFQLVERDAGVGDGAADIGAGRDHAEIAVEILHLCFAAARGAELVQQDYTLRIEAGDSPRPLSSFSKCDLS